MTKEKEIWEIHPTLWHYTTLQNSLSILNNKELWAFRYDTMNDVSEFIDTKNFIEENYDETINERLSTSMFPLDHADPDYKGEKFLSSFSKSPEDKDGLLTLWRFYAANGVAIIFDTEKLYQSIEMLIGAQISAMILDPVTYRNEHNYPNNIRNLVRIILTEFPNLSRDVDNKKLFEAVLKLVFLFKNHHYQDEQEVRLGVVVKRDNPAIGFTDKPIYSSAPFVKLPFNTNSIKEIIIGPGLSQKSNEYRIIQELQKMDLDIPIICSDIPYR